MTTFVETKYAPANTAEDSRAAVSNEVEEVRYATAQSALGWLLVARSDRGVCAVLLGNDPRELERVGVELSRKGFPRRAKRDSSLWPGGGRQGWRMERLFGFG
jgi:hypothetical protein